jgi:energy-coupling factor transport system ATP-binding protein
MNPVIAVTALAFQYPTGHTALDGVDLIVHAGERVAIIGENGAGKTTLARHLNGVHQPASGTVLVNGIDTAGRDVAELAGIVGYVFQNPDDQLFARTVWDELAFGPKNLGFTRERINESVSAALSETGLDYARDLPPNHLSLAERKRVALASVLAMQTPIILLDEPTTGQDAVGVGRIAEILARLSALGRTVVTITHDMDFCAENFDRVVVMAGGRVLLDGPSRTVFRDRQVLEESQVEPPQLARLAEGLGWPDTPLTVDEAAQYLTTQVG